MHRRNPEARLEMHLLAPATSGVVESEYCALRPAMAFREQGHCQENRRGSSGEPDTNCKITVDAEAPFQSRARLIPLSQVGQYVV
jgi:hypothetical protein